MKHVLSVAVALLFIATVSSKAQEYPSKPITLIVPFPPGGVADLTGRPTAIAMEKLLKQPVIVVNRAGAAGAVGNAQVAKSTPDGYTLLMALSSISVIPEAERACGKAAPYELREFAPIALISADPTVLAVRTESPYRTLRDLIDAAKKAPEKIAYSSSGIYGALHMPMEMFLHHYKLKMRHVPTTGGGPALTTLLGGHVELTAGGPAAITSHVKSGKLRPHVSWGARRHENYPDVPTFKEQGADIEYYIWSGLMAPRATPEPVLKVLRDTVRKAVEDADFKTAMARVNSPIQYMDAPEFAKYWDADAKRLAAVVKVVGKIEEKR